MRRAIFPGTFDPFTIGHYDIVLRGLAIFDEIVIGIGINQTKQTFFSLEKRLEMIRQSFQNEPRVMVKSYDDLTIHFAEQEDAAFILRGVRSVNDFEYERTIADANKQLTGIETVILNTNPAYSFVSSTVVRDLLVYKKDIKTFLPPNVIL